MAEKLSQEVHHHLGAMFSCPLLRSFESASQRTALDALQSL
jgi:hypothetical protein